MKIRDKSQKADKTTIITLLVLLALFIWWLASMSAQSNKEKLDSSIFSYRPIDKSTLSVEYRVKNTSNKSSKSDCTITMRDDSSQYVGSDFGYVSAKEIAPGDTYSGIANLKVSNDGAQNVTKGSISCTVQ